MESMDDLLGRIVISRAGRDRGEAYLVIGRLGEGVVLLADGERRPVDRPKKKNVKHVLVVGSSEEVRRKLMAGALVTDAEVRTAVLEAKVKEAR